MSGYGDKPFGLRQVTLTPVDGGAAVELPRARLLRFGETVLSGRQRGWGKIDRVVTVSDAVVFELEAGGISLEAYALMTGRTVTTSGTTPNQTTTLAGAAHKAFPYFKIVGKALSDTRDDATVTIFKAKLTDGLSGDFQDGQFWMSACRGMGIDDGVNGTWRVEQHEVETGLFVIGFSLVGGLDRVY